MKDMVEKKRRNENDLESVGDFTDCHWGQDWFRVKDISCILWTKSY